MTFSFMDLVVIAGLWVSALTLAFGIIKFFNSQIHARLTREISRLDDEIKEVKKDHVERIDSAMTQITSMVKDVKDEMHRATARLDEFYKTMITLTRGKMDG